MKRKLYNSLIEWKHAPDRKPLVLEGARQVGKTWLLKEFGKNEFDNLVYVNCHDDERIQNLHAIGGMDVRSCPVFRSGFRVLFRRRHLIWCLI